MHIVRKDSKKNRLYIMIGGVVTEDEARIISEKIIKTVNELKPGSDIIYD